MEYNTSIIKEYESDNNEINVSIITNMIWNYKDIKDKTKKINSFIDNIVFVAPVVIQCNGIRIYINCRKKYEQAVVDYIEKSKLFKKSTRTIISRVISQ